MLPANGNSKRGEEQMRGLILTGLMAILMMRFVGGAEPSTNSPWGSAADRSYAVVVQEATLQDAAWQPVVMALQEKHSAAVITWRDSLEEVLPELRRQFPRYTCFVSKPADAGGDFVATIHRLVVRLDEDPYTDTFWAILTGYDARNALQTARCSEPLTIERVASGTEFATEMVTEGQWYDELVQNRHVRKLAGSVAEEQQGPDDTTESLVRLVNEYEPDLMITSGHATQRGWQIGFRFRSGFFRSQAGQMFGVDTAERRIEIESPNPKVYLPIGNCLMGDIDGPDAMALAWMNAAGVRQMLGYTEPTWFGYMGWGVLDYFVEQPGRYSLTEAFFANHHALVHRLHDDRTPERDLRGLRFDRDVVAFYGDPAWSARMADLPKFYDQELQINGDEYVLTITPQRGEQSFQPVNTNGSQRGWRPMVQFLPQRVQGVQVLEGAELQPLITDDFVLVPNPRECDPARKYVVRFRAERVSAGL